VANLPTTSGKNETGDFNRFTDFKRRTLSVSHSEIKAKLDAEKRTSMTPASRASDVSSPNH
jgi:hypothetical protein